MSEETTQESVQKRIESISSRRVGMMFRAFTSGSPDNTLLAILKAEESLNYRHGLTITSQAKMPDIGVHQTTVSLASNHQGITPCLVSITHISNTSQRQADDSDPNSPTSAIQDSLCLNIGLPDNRIDLVFILENSTEEGLLIGTPIGIEKAVNGVDTRDPRFLSSLDFLETLLDITAYE